VGFKVKLEQQSVKDAIEWLKAKLYQSADKDYEYHNLCALVDKAFERMK